MMFGREGKRFVGINEDLHNQKLVEAIYLLAKYYIIGGKFKNKLDEASVSSVAIYGLGKLGELLVDYLRKEQVNVLFAIDRNPDQVFYDIDVYSPDQKGPDPDLIIITTIGDHESIKEQLKLNYSGRIVLFEDLIKSGLSNRPLSYCE